MSSWHEGRVDRINSFATLSLKMNSKKTNSSYNINFYADIVLKL